MWEYIKELPADLVGQKILSFLDLKSIVLLERALTCPVRLSTLHSFIRIAPSFSGNVTIPNDFNKWKWLKKRNCRITEGVVNLNMLTDAVDVDLIDKLALLVMLLSTSLPTNIEKLYSNAYEKCCTLEVFVLYEDLFSMVVLLSQLKNIRKMSVDCLTTIDWFASALLYVNITALEEITFTCFSTSQSAVIAIAKNCPNLKLLTMSSFANTNESLRILSEYNLPREKLEISGWLTELSADQATHCAHALSRIRSLHTGDLSYWLHCIPHLTGLREIRVGSRGDHQLLLILALDCLPLERVKLSMFSSATVVDVTVFIRSCSNTLTSLNLSGKSSIVGNPLITALAPHCPHLQELVISSPWWSTATCLDSSILALSWHCPQLRSLDIEMYGKVTELALLQLIAACPQLLMLRVSMNTKTSVLYGKLFQSYNRKTCWGTLKPHSTIAPWLAMRIAMLSLHCCQEAPQQPYTLDTLIRLF